MVLYGGHSIIFSQSNTIIYTTVNTRGWPTKRNILLVKIGSVVHRWFSSNELLSMSALLDPIINALSKSFSKSKYFKTLPICNLGCVEIIFLVPEISAFLYLFWILFMNSMERCLIKTRCLGLRNKPHLDPKYTKVRSIRE